MRCLTFLAMAMALLSFAAWAADVSGKWTGQMASPNGEGFTITFNFKQDGSKLTGNVQGPQGDPIDISQGKVEGDKISFVVTIDVNGGMKIMHDGTINGDEIKLNTKSDSGDFPGGAMTLKREK
jgi:hypothetical protein